MRLDKTADKTIMLAIALYAAAMLMIFNIISANAQEIDPNKRANAIKEDKSIDARTMDAQEGKLASVKGNSSATREYGQMMTIDHERDVKLFLKLVECKDSQVSAFAEQYLPMIQSQLGKINAIKNCNKNKFASRRLSLIN